MRSTTLILVAILCAGCTDTVLGSVIEPTNDIGDQDDLDRLALSFDPGSSANPAFICSTHYDREFAPWGEHYFAADWGSRSASFTPDLSLQAIIDVDTGIYDFGQVALAWRQDGKRLKLYIRENATVPQLPDGCFAFAEVEVDSETERNRFGQYNAPFALRPRTGIQYTHDFWGRPITGD